MNAHLRAALATALIGFATAGAAGPAAADVFVPRFMLKPPKQIDAGVFRIWSAAHPVGTEQFSFTLQNDSLVIASRFLQPLRNGDTLRKIANVTVAAFDYDLRSYQSKLAVGGQTLSRGITFADTVFTVYRQRNADGEGIAYLRPPGRFYALESMSFVLFDVICRGLARREFDTWTMNVFSLGATDSLLLVRAKNLGEETIRWGNAPVRARKLAFDDGSTEYLAWIGPEGRMLRLEHPPTELRVEREPPPARRVSAKRTPDSEN